MNPFQIPKCVLGFHHRDAKKAVRDAAGRFTSVCTGCGAPMWRYMDGWSVVRRDPVEVTTIGEAGGAANDAPRYRPIDE